MKTRAACGAGAGWMLAVLAVSPPAAAGAPFVESGRILAHPEVEFSFENYNGVTLQETDQLDGNTFAARATFPLGTSRQLRVELPYFSEGDAVLTQGGDTPGEVVGAPIHMKGNNGIFNFYSAILEQSQGSPFGGGSDFLWFYGFGMRLDPLETTFGDKLNDLGFELIGGARMDGDIADDVHLFASYRANFYFISDDIGPSDRGWEWFPSADAWVLSDLTAAAVLRRHSWFRPTVEARFQTDFLNYTGLLAGPGAVVPWNNLELKAGVLIGISADAEDYRARFGVSVRTF